MTLEGGQKYSFAGDITPASCFDSENGSINLSSLPVSQNVGYQIQIKSGNQYIPLSSTKPIYMGGTVSNVRTGDSIKIFYYDAANGCPPAQDTIIYAGPTRITGTGEVTQPGCTTPTGAIDLVVSGGTPASGNLYTFEWDHDPTLRADQATGLDPNIDSIYTVYIIDANGCRDTVTDTVNTFKNLDFSYNNLSQPLCTKDSGSIDIANLIGGSGNLHTISIDGASPAAFNISNPTVVLPIGDHIVEISDPSGCKDTVQVNIVDPKSPTLQFDKEFELLPLGGSTTLNVTVTDPNNTAQYPINYSSNAPSTGCVGANCTKIQFTLASGVFSDSVIATIIDINMCESSDTIRLSTSSDEDVYRPNVMLVDGLASASDPNSNGVFMIKTSPFISKVDLFEIWDRWGNKVYSQKDVAPGLEGWNGSINNDSKNFVNAGVYVYFVKYTTIDGNTGQRSGDITVLRED